MIQSITIQKLGNHLYPNINHNCLSDIQLSKKIEKILYRHIHISTCEVVFYEQFDIIDNDNILQFREKDIVRYLTTNDDFDIHFYINDHEFIISSKLYSLLESQYNFNFHKTLYRIEIW